MHDDLFQELISHTSRLYGLNDLLPDTLDFLEDLRLFDEVVQSAISSTRFRRIRWPNGSKRWISDLPIDASSVRLRIVNSADIWGSVLDAYRDYDHSPHHLLVGQVIEQVQFELSSGVIDRKNFLDDIFHSLIDRIASLGCTDDWKMRRKKRADLVLKRRILLSDYLRKLFSVNDALQVVQVDLGYARRFSKDVSQERVRADWRRFFDNGRRRTFFKNRVGYFWVLVPGYRRYCSSFAAVFLFRPEKCDVGRALGAEICQFWGDSITNGQGVGFDHDSAGAKARIANKVEEFFPENGQRGLSLFTDLEWCFLRKRAAERKNGLPRIETFGHGEIKIRRRA